MSNRILIADDEEGVRKILSTILTDKGYDVNTFSNGKLLLNSLINSDLPTAAVILDINMPVMDGFVTAKKIRQHFPHLPILGITGDLQQTMYKSLFQQGFYDIIQKPFPSGLVLARISNAIEHAKIPDFEKITTSLVRTLGFVGDARDSDTQHHNERLSEIACILAKGSGLSEQLCENLKKASVMHDIGKIAIQDEILRKPGRLTDDEFNAMKNHTRIGASILSRLVEDVSSKFIKMAHDIALHHHEKLDGSGYPSGLTKKDLPIEMRIVTVADIYDASTMKRPYHEERPHEKGVQILMEEAKNKKIDRKVVDVFLKEQNVILKVKKNLQRI